MVAICTCIYCMYLWICSVKMARYWPITFLASLWTSTPSPSNEHTKKELGQYPAILTKQASSITQTYLKAVNNSSMSCWKNLTIHVWFWRLQQRIKMKSFNAQTTKIFAMKKFRKKINCMYMYMYMYFINIWTNIYDIQYGSLHQEIRILK